MKEKRQISIRTWFLAVILLCLCMAGGSFYIGNVVAKKRCAEGRQKAYEILYASLAAQKTSFRMSIPFSADLDANDLGILLEQVMEEHPELFWLNGGYTVSDWKAEEMYQCTLHVRTKYEASGISEMAAKVEEEIKAILDQIDSQASDYEKARAVHDILTDRCRRAEDSYDGFEYYSDRDTVYECLVLGECDSTGYACAYQVLLTRLGIPCTRFDGKITEETRSFKATWNYIELEDGTYMVDVFSDDPEDNPSGSYQYDNFCLGEEQYRITHDTTNLYAEPPRCNGKMYLK